MKEWNAQRDTFTRLYHTKGLGLTEVRMIMAEQHGFFATKNQCKSIVKKWKLEKNFKKAKAMTLLRIRDKRALQGKETDFRFHGQPVNQQNLERTHRRHGGNGERPEWKELPSPDTPSHVEYWTPKPLLSATPGHHGDYQIGADALPSLFTSQECDWYSLFPEADAIGIHQTVENTLDQQMEGYMPCPNTPLVSDWYSLFPDIEVIDICQMGEDTPGRDSGHQMDGDIPTPPIIDWYQLFPDIDAKDT